MPSRLSGIVGIAGINVQSVQLLVLACAEQPDGLYEVYEGLYEEPCDVYSCVHDMYLPWSCSGQPQQYLLVTVSSMAVADSCEPVSLASLALVPPRLTVETACTQHVCCALS